MHQDTIEADGLQFAVLDTGGDGPLALCLHGFPDTAHTWRHLLPALAEAGYRAVAPYLRGYAPTEVPADGRYHLGALVTDAVALHESLGGGPDAVLVGHDWGALIGYGAAAYAPDRFRRLAALAVSPLGAVLGTMFDFDVLKRNWFVYLAQLPGLAEQIVGGTDFLERLWRDWSPGLDPTEDLVSVRESIGKPEHLSAALGYYRAFFDPSPPPEIGAAHAAAMGPVPCPVLYLHGADDGCAPPAPGAAALLGPGSETAVLPGVGHFLHLEQPGDVNRRIVEFLAG